MIQRAHRLFTRDLRRKNPASAEPSGAMPDGSGMASGIATPVTSDVESAIELPMSNPIIGFGVRPPKNSPNLRVIVTGGTGVWSLAAIKWKLPRSRKSKISGDVSRIVIGPVTVSTRN